MDAHLSPICIIRLGRAAGKVKYTLVDEDDLAWLGSKKIRCGVELLVDRNGNGTSVQAVCYHPRHSSGITHSRSSTHDHPSPSTAVPLDRPSSPPPLLGRFHANCNQPSAAGDCYYGDGVLAKGSLHALLWQHHMGRITDGFEVTHCNNVTLDNRLANLRLQPLSNHIRKRKHTQPPQDEKGAISTATAAPRFSDNNNNQSSDQNLYYSAVSLISSDPDEEQRVPRPRFCLDGNGDRITVDVYRDLFFECHYGPCTELEQEIRQFTMCGRCYKVRYCSHVCQADDWNIHKQFCKHKKGRSRPELGPER